MKKAEFKALFVSELQSNGIEIDAKKVDSALAKVARNAIQKHGATDWTDEYYEAGVNNAVYFYNEFNIQKSFNRKMYQSQRRRVL